MSKAENPALKRGGPAPLSPESGQEGWQGMTPEQHTAFVRNMRLNHRAEMALEGRLEEPGRAIADLLRSGAPIRAEVRHRLADFLDHRAALHGRPVARFSGTGQKSRIRQFEKRMELLRIADNFRESGMSADAYVEYRRGSPSERKLDRACACAREFARWEAEEMPWEFRSPEAVGAFDADEYIGFLMEQFVSWLLDHPDRDPARKS